MFVSMNVSISTCLKLHFIVDTEKHGTFRHLEINLKDYSGYPLEERFYASVGNMTRIF